jgi:hypothetical protein
MADDRQGFEITNSSELIGMLGEWCGMRVYLHRKEGDAANAGYWYRRAGRPASTVSPGEEWEAIVRALLDES